MKKSILNLGKALSKAEQKSVFGGDKLTRIPEQICDETMCLNMPNPNYNFGPVDPMGGPDQNGTVFVTGVCRNGRCYYS
tara:strand:- start:176 stop:412 length:237 start_codon:yes stop_codon:yes gene_type:complete